MTAIPPMDFPSSNGGREILHGIDMEFPKGGLTVQRHREGEPFDGEAKRF